MFGLFRIIKAAITPGIHPNRVRIKTIRNEPHPLSTIDKGGNMMANKTLQKDMSLFIDFCLLIDLSKVQIYIESMIVKRKNVYLRTKYIIDD